MGVEKFKFVPKFLSKLEILAENFVLFGKFSDKEIYHRIKFRGAFSPSLLHPHCHDATAICVECQVRSEIVYSSLTSR